jgi:hypothetical protein
LTERSFNEGAARSLLQGPTMSAKNGTLEAPE